MDVSLLLSAVKGLPISQVQYFEEVGSTNDEAQALLEQGAPDGALVMADTQSQGRGRLGRRWVSTPGAALTFSLAIRPTPREQERMAFFAPLAGLAVCQALVMRYGLPAEVKWPNDVLLYRRKTCGVLAEAAWQGERLHGVVVGIGVNVAPLAVPPDQEVMFPATCVEAGTRRPVDRLELLAAILGRFFALRPILGSPEFLQLWQQRLAFVGEVVRIDLLSPGETLTGRVVGVNENGNLCLRTQAGEDVSVAAGDVRLRPLE